MTVKDYLKFSPIRILPATATFFKCCSCGKKTRINTKDQWSAFWKIDDGVDYCFRACSKNCVARFFLTNKDYYNAYVNKEIANAAAKHFGENKSALLEFLKELNKINGT